MFKINTFKTNYQTKPLNIVDNHPSFSWNYAEGSTKQKSYRLLVSNDASLLEKDEGNLWDSGVIESSEMVAVVYQGQPFESKTIYYVKLIVQSGEDETDTLMTTFETTIRENSEWVAKWVSLPNSASGGTLYFRKQEELKDKTIKKARAYVSGIGYYEFFINGEKVSNSVLNPGETDYNHTILFDTFAIESYLKQKDVVFGFEVGYGWYGSRVLLAQIEIIYEDDEVQVVSSSAGPGWWVTRTPTTYNSIYDGETYDARIESNYGAGWCSPDYTPDWNNGWMFPIYPSKPIGKLRPQTIEPIEKIRTFKYASQNKLDDNNIVFNIGQNLAGWAKIQVKGAPGSQVELRFAEGINEDGSVNQYNLRSALAKDTYILKGEGVETFAPRFTYHGFQYVQATLIGDVELIDLEAEHIFGSVEKVGFFESSDEILNKLHHMAVITEENNIHSVLTDCPQRDERWGWLNDLTVRLYQEVYNFDMARYFEKITQDILETQTEEGAITDTAPYHSGGLPADFTSISYLLLGIKAYKYYGNVSLIKKHFAGFQRWVDFLLTKQTDYIADYTYYADWVAPVFENNQTDPIFVSTVFLYWHVRTLAELAKLIEQKETHNKYLKIAEKVKTKINTTYFDEKTNQYASGTQAENSLALSLEIPEEKYRKKIAENIKDNVIKFNYHSTCGNQAYRHLFYVLSEYGYTDVLIKMIKNPEYPGWGNMVALGATTVWERWESEMGYVMHSYNHPMFGSYDAWFYRYLGGIRIDGYGANEIVIKPHIPETLTYVKSSFKSIRGLIQSNWTVKNQEVEHEIIIPANTQATVVLEGNVEDISNPYANKVYQNNVTVLTLTSGTYKIIVGRNKNVN